MSDPSLSGQALSTWDNIAQWWDAGITLNGNNYWQVLQEPCLTRLLSSQVSKPTSRALDLATGNGLCARWLASRGAQAVLATDGNWEALIRDEEEQGPGGKFDAVLINMAIMDIAEIGTFAASVPKLLRKDGVFVTTVLRPVFITSNAAKSITIDYDPVMGEKRVVLGKLVTQYLDVKPAKGVAVVGQPEKQVGAVLPSTSGGKH
ncbi:hypothetical protein B0T14DRAFT_497090 [Immersiella caudata]|uniref:Methyltransferase type 11 domain-containing protein n=1 Tax=Immersiella caudata TaxID=314043 RepID=A0AA40C0Z5_9PEZI|nr:hypothetical protein B0T14DRAFT_497090 [Immersiella caudata]